MLKITLAEASEKLAHFLEMVSNGEEVIIFQENQPIAKLSPISSNQHPPQSGSAKELVWMADDLDDSSLPEGTSKRRPAKAGSAKGLVWMADDFDEPLEDFKEYME